MRHDTNHERTERIDEALRDKWTSASALAGHPDLFEPSAAADCGSLPSGQQRGTQPQAAQPTGLDAVRDCPPWVLRGAKSQVAVGIDWMTLTGPMRDLEPVSSELERRFGPFVSKGGKGFQHGGSRLFANGAMIAFDDLDKENPIIRVELNGNVLSGMSGDEAVELLKVLLLGRKCTRIDIRLDWQCPDGERVGLIDLATASCRRDELCRARRWKPHEDMDGIERVGHGLYVGRRGKDGSGRYLRIYDKGLETGERSAGTWERFEVEHTSDVANDVAIAIAKADDWLYTSMAIALGAVDFRENNGSRELERRPRVSWWSQLLEGIEPVNVRSKRVPTSFERNVGWMRQAMAPKMKAMAIATGQTFGDVAADLLGDVLPHRDGERDAVVAGFLKYSKESA